MFTAIVLFVIAILWLRANSEFIRSHSFDARRSRSRWAWSFIGAATGSYIGIAGFGTAIAATIPAAVVCYFAADYLMTRKNGFAELSPYGSGREKYQKNSSLDFLRRVVGVLPSIFKSILAIAIFFAVGAIGVAWYEEIRVHKAEPLIGNKPVPYSVAPQSASPNPGSSPYDEELTRIERLYPQLNPDSPTFNQRVVNSVKLRMEEQRTQGMQPEIALRNAVKEVMAPVQSMSVQRSPVAGNSPATPRNKNPYPNCVYKGVMSDEDYLACGVQPPGSR